MKMTAFPFSVTTWEDVPTTEHAGESGTAVWRTQFFGSDDNPIRVRMVEYSAGYLADHWCEKGHVLLCLKGELESRLKDGRVFKLLPGTSYQVGDNAEPHQSYTANGATLFIVD